MSSVQTQRRVLFTGASRGIGKATAIALSQAGMDVAKVTRSPEKLARVATADGEAAVKSLKICDRASDIAPSQIFTLSGLTQAIAFGSIP